MTAHRLSYGREIATKRREFQGPHNSIVKMTHFEALDSHIRRDMLT